MKPKKTVFRVRFEKFDSLIELLPTIYYHKQSFRERFGRGVIVIGWLKWGLILYIEYIEENENM